MAEDEIYLESILGNVKKRGVFRYCGSNIEYRVIRKEDNVIWYENLDGSRKYKVRLDAPYRNGGGTRYDRRIFIWLPKYNTD